MKDKLLHLVEFLISPGLIWGCLMLFPRKPLLGLRAAWWGQTGYDREPFAGPRWDKEAGDGLGN